eukprot:4719539-Amphidinium_carterae.1
MQATTLRKAGQALMPGLGKKLLPIGNRFKLSCSGSQIVRLMLLSTVGAAFDSAHLLIQDLAKNILLADVMKLGFGGSSYSAVPCNDRCTRAWGTFSVCSPLG